MPGPARPTGWGESRNGEAVATFAAAERLWSHEESEKALALSKHRRTADAGRVPGRGVASGAITVVAGVGRVGQAATAGSPTMGSSLKGAMVSSVM